MGSGAGLVDVCEVSLPVGAHDMQCKEYALFSFFEEAVDTIGPQTGGSVRQAVLLMMQP